MAGQEHPIEPLAAFAQLLGDSALKSEAATEIWQRTHWHLRNLLSEMISQRLQGRVSEESALQEAYRSFFSHAGRGEYEVSSDDNVIGLLAQMARNKLISHMRAIAALKRSPEFNNPESGQVEDLLGNCGDNATILEGGQIVAEPERINRFYAGREPCAPMGDSHETLQNEAIIAQFLQGAETVARTIYLERVETLPPDLKECLRLKVQGFDASAIADQMRISIDAAKWKIETLQAEFQDLASDSEFGADAPKLRRRRAP